MKFAAWRLAFAVLCVGFHATNSWGHRLGSRRGGNPSPHIECPRPIKVTVYSSSGGRSCNSDESGIVERALSAQKFYINLDGSRHNFLVGRVLNPKMCRGPPVYTKIVEPGWMVFHNKS
eukprot:scaffold4725_cov140-Skeletonema_dohrnii-CCMP3373.AAC.11